MIFNRTSGLVAEVRARAELLSAELKAPNTIQLKQKVTVDIEGVEKPACVSESLFRLTCE